MGVKQGRQIWASNMVLYKTNPSVRQGLNMAINYIVFIRKRTLIQIQMLKHT